jgi:hypothetical protein
LNRPNLEFLLQLRCELAPSIDVGVTPTGQRRVVEITSGVFEGPRMRGIVLPGGADWQVVRADGVIELHAHYLLQSDDGVVIAVRNNGLRHSSPEVFARMTNGETVDASEYYCRTAPLFEAPMGQYQWLNQSLFLGTATRLPTSIILDFYRVA